MPIPVIGMLVISFSDSHATGTRLLNSILTARDFDVSGMDPSFASPG